MGVAWRQTLPRLGGKRQAPPGAGWGAACWRLQHKVNWGKKRTRNRNLGVWELEAVQPTLQDPPQHTFKRHHGV